MKKHNNVYLVRNLLKFNCLLILKIIIRIKFWWLQSKKLIIWLMEIVKLERIGWMGIQIKELGGKKNGNWYF